MGYVCAVEVTPGRSCISSEFCVLCGSGSARCESSWLCSSLRPIPELGIPAGTGAAPGLAVQVSLPSPTELPRERETLETARHPLECGGHPASSPSSGTEAFAFGSRLPAPAPPGPCSVGNLPGLTRSTGAQRAGSAQPRPLCPTPTAAAASRGTVTLLSTVKDQGGSQKRRGALRAAPCHGWAPPWASGKEQLHGNPRFPWITSGGFGGRGGSIPRSCPRCPPPVPALRVRPL